jgi:hypothetical protein
MTNFMELNFEFVLLLENRRLMREILESYDMRPAIEMIER